MKVSKTKAGLLALAAIGGLAAVGAAQAAARPDIRLVHISATAAGRDSAVWRYVRPNASTFPVTDAAAGLLNVPVTIDGWALIDQTNCVQVGTPGPFSMPRHDAQVAWNNALITSTLGNGACPGMQFTFSGVGATWLVKAPRHTMDVQVLTATTTGIPKQYGLGANAKIQDTVTFSYGKR